jgi:membrane-associated phospholipid phosphatase
MVETITNLGDAALLLPASLLLFGYLYLHNDPRRAASLALATGACLTITVLAKLTFLALNAGCLQADVQSPSGHTSFSATFYGCGAAVAASGAAPWRQRLTWTAAITLVLAVAASRVVLGAHTVWEVAIGLAIGASCVGVFLFQVERPRPASGFLRFVLAVAVLAIVLQGTHLTIEPHLRNVADRLGFAETSKCHVAPRVAPLP